MADDVDTQIQQTIAKTRFPTGFTEISVEDMALTTQRIGSVMLDVGRRTWTLYYAAQAGNWRLARSQYQEISELFELAALLRPQYAEHLHTYIADDWPAVGEAIQALDFGALKEAFDRAIDQANAYHDLEHRGFIRWKLPATPPPDLDLEPRPEDRTLGDWAGRGGGQGGGGGTGGGTGGGRPGGGHGSSQERRPGG